MHSTHVGDGGGELLGCFLGNIVADSVEHPVLIGAGVERAVAGAVLGGAVEVAADGDGGHADGWLARQALLVGGITSFALSQAQPPSVVVDHDGDMVGIVERRRAQVVGRVGEVP